MCTLTNNQKQFITSTIILTSESFRVFIATLLSVFVPQRCDNQPDKICTIYHNFYQFNLFNLLVLVFNFITLASFIVLYTIEYKREIWCIEYLDINPNLLEKNLKTEIENYPKFKQTINNLNELYKKSAISVSVLTIINFILSAVLIIHYYYLDSRSVTVLVTNFLLIIDKLINCIKISTKSVEEEAPSSAYITIPIKYNTIDNDYKINNMERCQEPQNKNIGWFPPIKYYQSS